jgi:hypothetical protein
MALVQLAPFNESVLGENQQAPVTLVTTVVTPATMVPPVVVPATPLVPAVVVPAVTPAVVTTAPVGPVSSSPSLNSTLAQPASVGGFPTWAIILIVILGSALVFGVGGFLMHRLGKKARHARAQRHMQMEREQFSPRDGINF